MGEWIWRHISGYFILGLVLLVVLILFFWMALWACYVFATMLIVLKFYLFVAGRQVDLQLNFNAA